MDQVQKINSDEVEFQEYLKKQQTTRVKLKDDNSKRTFYGNLIGNTIILDLDYGKINITDNGTNKIQAGLVLQVEDILNEKIVDLSIWKIANEFDHTNAWNNIHID